MIQEKQLKWARLERSLEGLALGDAFGERFFGDPVVAAERMIHRALPEGPWRYTDDTEMALAIADVIKEHGEVNQDALAQTFARRYTRAPRRGYGGGAMELLQRLEKGVFWGLAARELFEGGSYGNGGAMRAAPLGAYFADEGFGRVVEQATKSAEVTHAHPEGQAGAVAVAVAAAQAVLMAESSADTAGRTLIEAAHAHTPAGKTRQNIEDALNLGAHVGVEVAAQRLGTGRQVSAQDTVGFSLWCAARHWNNFEEAMWCTVAGWGDRDTTCAIVGGILGAGNARLPKPWLSLREKLEFGI